VGVEKANKQNSEQSETQIHIAPTSAMLVAVLASLPEKLYSRTIGNAEMDK